MTLLQGIRAIPTQTFRTPIDQGLIEFTLYFKPAIAMWMIDVTFGGFSVNSVRVCNSPNILEQFSEIIPFGLLVSVGSNRGYEPSLIDDFSSSRAEINILDQDELQQIEDVYVELRG